jgi:hypothetical protein
MLNQDPLLFRLTPDSLFQEALHADAADLNSGGIPMPLRSAGNPLASQWKLLIYSSIAWFSILLITITAFVIALEKQDRKLELLLERTTPSLKQE